MSNHKQRLACLESRRGEWRKKNWHETPEGKRELAVTMAAMDLSVCGGYFRKDSDVVLGEENGCPYAGLPVEKVIACFWDRPDPATADLRLEQLKTELAAQHQKKADEKPNEPLQETH